MSDTSTRTERVYNDLRNDIIAGNIKPGSQLPFARLKETYGASIGVLREALMRLSGEGLAINHAQQGFRVMEISLEDLQDLTSARCLIEAMVLKESIQNGDLEWESRIVAAHYTLERTPVHQVEGEVGHSDAYVIAHHSFHMALCSAASNQRLINMVASLRAASEVYTQWSIPLENPKRDAASEHKQLLDLCLSRDAAGAIEALNAHLQVTARLVLEAAKEPAK